jgi:uncharacterized Tic20 family protein
MNDNAPQPEPQPPPIGVAADAKVADKNATTWAMLCHLSALAGYVIPLGNIFGPLVVWQLKKNEHPFIDEQGKEALNFQITIIIMLVVAGILVCVGVGIFLIPAVLIYKIIMIVIACIKAGEGVHYQYPMTLRLVK